MGLSVKGAKLKGFSMPRASQNKPPLVDMNRYFGRMKAKEKCPPRKPIKKILWSWVGSFIGIGVLSIIDQYLRFSTSENMILIGSFGASAVLVYGAPLAEFSQPRNLIGGHLISALVGVSVFLVVGQIPALASALAVSLAILAMHLTCTMHPPGGATALIAVVGGENIHKLGYGYVIYPILYGAILMLLVGLLVNNLSRNPKRHYPVYWI